MKEDFERKKAAFRERGIPAKPIYAYHGTKKTVISTILQENFEINWQADGIYGPGDVDGSGRVLTIVHKPSGMEALTCNDRMFF